MMSPEGVKAFGQVVKKYIQDIIEPISQRIERLEGVKQAIPMDGRDGVAGKDGLPGRDGRDGVDGKNGVDGQDGVNGQAGKDGAPGRDGQNGIDGQNGKDGRDGTDGQDGKDGLPGQDGQDGIDGQNGKDGRDGIDGQDGKDGLPGKNGQDGRHGLNGQDGKDGVAGADGQNGLNGADGRDGKDAIEIDILPGILPEKSYPRGTYAHADGGILRAFRNTDALVGEPVRCGWDVVVEGIKEISITHHDRLFNIEVIKTSGAAARQSFSLPLMLYKGVFKVEQVYEAGDVVTWAGSTWHCNGPTSDKPGESSAWTLVVKKGRDGKDGLRGEKGLPGDKGQDGQDYIGFSKLGNINET